VTPSTATPTAPVPQATATATSTPATGCALTFASFYDEQDEFCGNVSAIEKHATIPGGLLFDPISAPPGATFAVVFISVANFGNVPDDVGIFSFRLRDNQSHVFTMDFPDELIAQFNAEDHFGRDGLYETIQPGLSRNLAVVFLVPSGVVGLAAERCPVTGCEDGAPAPPAPPSGCSLALASFYTDPATVCANATQIQRLTTIPGGDFYGPVTAPPWRRVRAGSHKRGELQLRTQLCR
jgi:hypothetical protein